MKTTSLRLTTCAVAAFFAGSAVAADVPLYSYPDPAGFAVQYGDFYSFSLPILSAAVSGFTDSSLNYNNGSPYYINTANVIQNALVVGTGSGNTNNTDLGLSSGFVQNGFNFPNVNGNGLATFSTTDPTTYSPTDPGGNGVNTATADKTGTWDIEMTALRQFLTRNGVLYDMVAYFNNNQQKRTVESNNLYAWAQITLTDYQDPNNTKTLFFKDGNSLVVDGFGHTEYVLSGGPVTLCFNYNNGVNNNAGSSVVPCSGTFQWTHTFEHNLGQNDVAYGITSKILNDIIHNDYSYDLMSIRVDFEALNNGYENLYLAAACVGGDCGTEHVPEPGSLALIAAGILGLAGVSRRRRDVKVS